MCINADAGVELQCAREYWADTESLRTTQLHKLTPSERQNIPTENMASERYLARFGSLASISAAKSNRFFKAIRIRDDLMFKKSLSVIVLFVFSCNSSNLSLTTYLHAQY